MGDEELAYAILTPHTVRKSRTGIILSRLISRSGLDCIAARMFAPGEALTQGFAEAVSHSSSPETWRFLLADYIRTHFVNHPEQGNRHRVLLLVFRGPDAVNRIRKLTGETGAEFQSGRTLRDSFAEHITDADGNTLFYEPALIVGNTAEEVREHLLLWTAFAESDGGLLEDVPQSAGEIDKPVERTLALIKPDNFRFPNRRPGEVLDVFSQSGLNLIACRLHHMSVAEAERFYGPVLHALRESFKDTFARELGDLIEEHYGAELSDEERKQLGETAGPIMGRKHWEKLVRFMAGATSADVENETERQAPGTAPLLLLVFEGPDAVSRIRQLLGSTDPSRAAIGTVRREFGESVMINAGHASDSPENAANEIRLLNPGQDDLTPFIQDWYSGDFGSKQRLVNRISKLFHNQQG